MSLFSVTMAVCWWPEIRVVLFPGCLWPCDRVCAEAYQHLYDTCLCPRSSSISGHLLDVFHHQVRWQHSGGWDKGQVKVSSSNPQIIFRFKCLQFIWIPTTMLVVNTIVFQLSIIAMARSVRVLSFEKVKFREDKSKRSFFSLADISQKVFGFQCLSPP